MSPLLFSIVPVTMVVRMNFVYPLIFHWDVGEVIWFIQSLFSTNAVFLLHRGGFEVVASAWFECNGGWYSRAY